MLQAIWCLPVLRLPRSAQTATLSQELVVFRQKMFKFNHASGLVRLSQPCQGHCYMWVYGLVLRNTPCRSIPEGSTSTLRSAALLLTQSSMSAAALCIGLHVRRELVAARLHVQCVMCKTPADL